MKLTRLFAIAMVTLALLIIAMLGRILQSEWQDYRTSQEGLQGLQLIYQSMRVAELVSTERAPANILLSQDSPQAPVASAALAAARHASDAALTSLASAIAVAPGHQPALLPAIAKARASLASARDNLDRVAALPMADRTRMQIRLAQQQMFNVIPIILDVENILSHKAEDTYQQFSACLMSARFSVYLREDAGRLGSLLMSSMVAQKPLNEGEHAAIDAFRARLDQLRLLIELPVDNSDADPRVRAAIKDMRHQFFDQGLRAVAIVEHNGNAGAAAMTPLRFSEQYVPALASIVRLRDALMSVTVEQVRKVQERAQRELIFAFMMGALILLLLAGLFLIVSKRFVRPLLWTTRTLTGIADGDLDTEVPLSSRRDEIGDMLRAVRVLRASNIEKRQLEQERQRLIEELRISSDTDYLTGILNRRAFTDACNERGRRAREHNMPLAIIMFDIDHFKAVNDQYGHDAGDLVLIRIAELVRQELREGEVVARYGGEEFIIMPANCSLEAARVMAERIRAAIEKTVFSLPERRTLQVTASFGVAQASGPLEPLDSMFSAADKALYRAKEAGRNRVVCADAPAAAIR
jgi:diguanylate cyclase (GGDEF)-like protein